MYEKVGEATEVALKVLAEKLNVQGLDRSGLTPAEKATACLKTVEKEFKKVVSHTLWCVCHLVPSLYIRSSLWSSPETASP